MDAAIDSAYAMCAMTVSCSDACLVLQCMQCVMLPCAHLSPTPSHYSGADTVSKWQYPALHDWVSVL